MHLEASGLHRVVSGEQTVAVLLERDMLPYGYAVLLAAVGECRYAVFGVIER